MPKPEDRPGDDRPIGHSHWFEDLANHMGSAYLRYSFTKGTEQEVDFLSEALALTPGMRLLDVGCGPGRHSLALAGRGIDTVGIDISRRFVELASAAAQRLAVPATFVCADARDLTFDEEFDAVISLCQGAFGLQGLAGADASVLDGIARALRPGGLAAVSAFSAYFQVRYLEDSTFDAATGVNHEIAVIRNEQGREAEHDLWTTCFTPRELRLLAVAAGLEVVDLWSVEPGKYAARRPDIDHTEFLVLLRKR